MTVRPHAAPPRALLLACFTAVLLFYVYTLCPTVYWDDSGELITAAYVLGIPHPPGEPLYTMLGWIFTHLPGIPSPAYGMNLMSAVFGAITWTLMAGWLWQVQRTHDVAEPVATTATVLATLTGAAGSITWHQSVIAENTTMHTAFMAALLWWAWRIGTGPRLDDRPLLLHMLGWASIYGLSASNHPAGVFLFPAFAGWFIYAIGLRVLRPHWVLGMLACACAGFLPYAYLYFASRANPPLDWGNPETWENFRWVVTAQQYAGSAFTAPGAAFLYRGSWELLKAVGLEWGVAGGIVAFVGWLRLVARDKPLALWPLPVLAVFAFLSANPAYIGAYLVPAFLFLTPALAAGVTVVLTPLALRGPRLLVAGSIAAAALPALAVGTHWSANNLRTDDLALRYGEHVLAQLPPDAILVTESGAMRFVLLYMVHCEGRRPDIVMLSANAISRPGYLHTVAHQHPDLQWPESYVVPADPVRFGALGRSATAINPPWTRGVLLGVYDANAHARRMFWENPAPYGSQLDPVIPVGWLFESRRPLPAGARAAWADLPDAPGLWSTPEPWDPRMEDRAGARMAYAQVLSVNADYVAMRGDFARAADLYQQARRLEPHNPAYLANLAIALAQVGRHADAERAFQAAVRLSPDTPLYKANLSHFYDTQGRSGDALTWARRAVDGWPEAPHDLLTRLAELEFAVGEPSRALASMRTVAAARPEDPQIQLLFGQVALQVGELGLAEAAVATALELAADDVHVRLAAAWLAVAQGAQTEEVEGALAQVLAADPERGSDLVAAHPVLGPYAAPRPVADASGDG